MTTKPVAVGTLSQLASRPEAGSFVGMIAVYVFFALMGGANFIGAPGISSVLNMSSEVGIIALSVGLLMIAGQLDMSVGAIEQRFYQEFVERLILSGTTMIGDRKVYKVTMMTNAGTSLNDYYDVETGLKLRRVDMKFMYGKSLKIVTDYSDYQAAGGVLFPRTMAQSGGPVGAMTMHVTAIEVNKPQDQTFFNTGLPPLSDE